MTTAVVMTYDSLVENIQSYLERSDAATINKIPLFIMLAEQTIASQIKFLGNLTVNTSTTITGESVINKPARWHKTVSMNITVDGKRQPVLLRKPEYLREYWQDPTQTGTPKFYADYDYTHSKFFITSASSHWIPATKATGLRSTPPRLCCMAPCCKPCRS